MNVETQDFASLQISIFTALCSTSRNKKMVCEDTDHGVRFDVTLNFFIYFSTPNSFPTSVNALMALSK